MDVHCFRRDKSSSCCASHRAVPPQKLHVRRAPIKTVPTLIAQPTLFLPLTVCELPPSTRNTLNSALGMQTQTQWRGAFLVVGWKRGWGSFQAPSFALGKQGEVLQGHTQLQHVVHREQIHNGSLLFLQAQNRLQQFGVHITQTIKCHILSCFKEYATAANASRQS